MSSEPSAPEHPRRAARERWAVVLATVIVIIQLVTLPIVFSLAEERETGHDDREGEEPEPAPEIAPQEFSGDEPGRTETFSIEGGLTVFEIEGGGGGNFIAVLEDEDFQRVTGLINTIGAFRGSTARHVEAGEHVLAMNGRDWSVTVTQPRYAEGDTPPVSFSGEGLTATEPFEIEPAEPEGSDENDDAESGDGGENSGENSGEDGGEDGGNGGEDGGDDSGNGESPDEADGPSGPSGEREESRRVRFAITHEGDSNVRMRLLDRDGRRVTGILNDRGSVETVEEAELSPGIYLFDVQAEGEWTIEVEVP